MAKFRILPTLLVAALAVGAGAVVAQEAAQPPGETAANAERRAPRAKPAMIRLDFGAGRKVEVMCGDSDLAACVETIAPLVEKVASTPAERGKGEGKDHRQGGKGKPGKDHGPKPGDAPAEAPAAETPAE